MRLIERLRAAFFAFRNPDLMETFAIWRSDIEHYERRSQARQIG